MALQRLGRRGRHPGRRLGAALEPARQLGAVELAQLGRQGRQRHLAQAALVILGAEFHQLAPAPVQCRQALQHARDRLGPGFGEPFGRGIRAVPDHAQHLAGTQRHAHQRTRCERQLTSVGERRTHAAVGRGGDDDAGPKSHG
ncbi:hypothetical protein D9M68_776780 [compost metagenome]